MNYRRNFYLLMLIASLFLLLNMIEGYLKGWSIYLTHYDAFYRPRTTFQNALGNFIPFTPLLFIGWMLFVNGKKQLRRKLLIYTSLFLGYVVLFAVAVLMVSFISAPVGSVEGGVLFGVITSGLNYLLSKVENNRLERKEMLALFFSAWLVPIFCILWTELLLLFVRGDFAEDCFSNGGAFFAFMLYEGIYFLWLKSEQTVRGGLKIEV